jgi:hypothetical protein
LQCSNNLRQQGLALQQQITLFQRLPSIGGHALNALVKGGSGNLISIETEDYDARQVYQWGIGSPRPGRTGQAGSWAFAILPQLEQTTAYNKIELSARQPVYLCPSRSRGDPLPTIDDNYGRYVSGGWAVGEN